MANPADINYFIVKETVAGTTPATPVFKRFHHNLGDTLQTESEMIESNLLMPNRTKAAAVKAGFSASGELKTDFRRDDAIESLMESVFSNTFATNVLKRGETNQSYTIEKRFKQGATTHYQRWVGFQGASMNVSCEANTAAEVSFGLTGMGDGLNGTAIIPGATYPASTSNGKRLTGLDVSNVTVAGLTATYQSLELSVEATRSAYHGFGSANALGVDQDGAGTATLTLKLYRSDLSAETAFTTSSTPVAVSFTIGTGVNGYTITLPAAVCETPKSEDDGVSMFVTLVFRAAYDATTGTDIQITRLT